MKILIIANSSSGLYDFRCDLIKKLINLNNEVVALVPFKDKIEELKSLGIKVIDTPMDRRGINPFKDLKLYKIFKKILKDEKPNLVITYTIKPNVYGGYACKKLKIPYAVNITGLGSAFENGGLIKRLVIIMYKLALKKAKIVFFENEGNRQIFLKYKIVREEHTYRLNGAGVDLNKFQVSDYPKGDKIRFLFIGRVMAEKGVNELFSAMKRLIDNGKNVELDILGEFEENYSSIIKQYEVEGWLHYYGYQLDVRPYIQNSHCFVLPSWHEGMANTNLENAASGRPIITSNIFGCKEAVINEVSGYLFGKKDEKDLFDVMNKFCDLPYECRKQMGLEGRKHMVQIFDKKKVVDETIKKLL